MKTYDFARLQARPFPTVAEARNPFIYGRVGVVVNVSQRDYPEELVQEFEKAGITFHHLPLVETGDDMGMDNILKAVGILEEADRAGKAAVVHCNFGNNRSRVVAEAFHFRKTGFQLEDEYKKSFNHLLYNCHRGLLPPPPVIEEILSGL